MPQLPLIKDGKMTAPHEHAERLVRKHLKKLIAITRFSEQKLYGMCRPPQTEDDESATGRKIYLVDFLQVGVALSTIDRADAEDWMRYPLDYLNAVAEELEPDAGWDPRATGRTLADLGTKAGFALVEHSKDARAAVTELRNAADRALVSLHAGKA